MTSKENKRKIIAETVAKTSDKIKKRFLGKISSQIYHQIYGKIIAKISLLSIICRIFVLGGNNAEYQADIRFKKLHGNSQSN